MATVPDPRDRLLGGLLSPDFDDSSCLSRYSAALYRRPSLHAVSTYLVSALRRYESLHRRCGPGTPGYARAVELLRAHDVIVEGVVVVPDGVEPVRAAIAEAVASGARVVLTTGGTGVTPRDLTPEGTAPLLTARLEGIEAQIRAYGLTKTPLSGLSRGLVGVTSREATGALVVNAPGSRGGVKDAVAVIGPLVPHVLEQLGGGDH